MDFYVILSLMNKSLDIPEMFITDTSHKVLSVASQDLWESKTQIQLFFSLQHFQNKKLSGVFCKSSVTQNQSSLCLFNSFSLGCTDLSRRDVWMSYFVKRRLKLVCLLQGDTRLQMDYEALFRSLLTKATQKRNNKFLDSLHGFELCHHEIS